MCLQELNYQSIHLFELFSSFLAGWGEEDIEREVHASIALMND